MSKSSMERSIERGDCAELQRKLPKTALTAVVLILASIAIGDEAAAQGDKQFSLKEGSGVAVCEAYLELLNKTHFDTDPFCGRPADGPVDGFEDLNRHNMDAADIFPLFRYVYEFVNNDDQHHVDRFFQGSADPSDLNPEPLAGIEDALKHNWLKVWTYSHPVDIENNGTNNRILIWRGHGATDNSGVCGVPYGSHGTDFSYPDQRAFILAADGKQLDEQRTREVFGAHSSDIAHKTNSPQLASGKPFRSLADSIDIFEFSGRYYIQTMNRPKSGISPLRPVNVFLRMNGQTKRICSFNPESVPRILF
jgi:hypothetical protein